MLTDSVAMRGRAGRPKNLPSGQSSFKAWGEKRLLLLLCGEMRRGEGFVGSIKNSLQKRKKPER